MGGVYARQDCNGVDALLTFLHTQIQEANKWGLTLQDCVIYQVSTEPEIFEVVIYFGN